MGMNDNGQMSDEGETKVERNGKMVGRKDNNMVVQQDVSVVVCHDGNMIGCQCGSMLAQHDEQDGSQIEVRLKFDGCQM